MKILTVLCLIFLIGCTKTPEPDYCPANAHDSPYDIIGTLSGANRIVRLTHGEVYEKSDDTFTIYLHHDTCDVGTFGFWINQLKLNDTTLLIDEPFQTVIEMFDHNDYHTYYPDFINSSKPNYYAILTSISENIFQLQVETLMIPRDSSEKAVFLRQQYDSVFVAANLTLTKK